MKIIQTKTAVILGVCIMLAACMPMERDMADDRDRPSETSTQSENVKKESSMIIKENYSLNTQSGNQRIVLAGGCFWGTERYLEQIPGVERTFVGYANGKTEAPTYEEVCTGTTGHAEAVFVEYNPQVVELKYLLTYFFKTMNPTSVNRQGNDIGSQYRSGIYFFAEQDLPVIQEFIKREQKNYSKPIQTEVLPLQNMYPAEEYHQKYLVKNPNGYCHVQFDTLPTEKDVLRDDNNSKTGELWQYQVPTEESLKELSDLSFQVTQNKATERPFTSPYDQEFSEGIYVDITNGQPLFSSKDKFDAGCGWPSFSRPIEEALIAEEMDTSHNMVRTEVLSELSGAHLGHVFPYAPTNGLRYCINGASLRFVPKEKMEEEGYGYLLKLFSK